jgi:hypothetical protein
MSGRRNHHRHSEVPGDREASGRRACTTAAELIVELERDPGYVTFVEQVEQERAFHRDEYLQAAVGMLGELHAAGYPVGSLGELRQSGYRYPGAIPVLVRWLPQIADRYVKEDLIRALSIRALSVPWAKAEAEPILQQGFRQLPGEQNLTGTLRWAIGNAPETMTDRSSFDSLADLARDRQFGTAREVIVLALAKTNDPRAVDVLLELLDDPDVVVAALAALGKLKATNARDAIAKLTGHVLSEVAKEAQAALSRITK